MFTNNFRNRTGIGKRQESRNKNQESRSKKNMTAEHRPLTSKEDQNKKK
jgi:hypothetical protein